MKKLTRFLRFLSLLFFTFLAIMLCLVFNKVLDNKIEEQHAQAVESLTDYNKELPEDQKSALYVLRIKT